MRRLAALAPLALVLLVAAAPALAQETTAARLPTVDSDVAARAPIELPPPSVQALRFYRTGHWVWAGSVALGIAAPALILWSGLSVAMRSRAERLVRFWPVSAALFVALYLAAEWLLSLPFSCYAGFLRQHAYGLSNQSFAQWLRESAIDLGVSAAIAGLFFWVPLLLLRRLPRFWWLLTGALCVPFFALILLVRPVWIDPLTDDFGRMKDEQLEARILALAERAGIDGARVYQVEKSADTNRLNAYVTGFGATQRIVLWDTLLAKLTPEQTLVVMGHEMGHYVLRHIPLGIAAFSAILTGGLYLVHVGASAILRRSGARLGLRGLADPAALPLLLVVAGVVQVALLPAAYAFSRHQEHEADRFALEITRDNRACAGAFVAMQQTNLGIPHPDAWVVWMRSTHPPLGERVDFCNTYRPWDNGEPGHYEPLFLE
jgi:Zn-dependent protease with chaperone function